MDVKLITDTQWQNALDFLKGSYPQKSTSAPIGIEVNVITEKFNTCNATYMGFDVWDCCCIEDEEIIAWKHIIRIKKS